MSYLKQLDLERAELDQLADDLGNVPLWHEGALILLNQLEAIGTAPNRRLPVLRRGERADIPPLTRRLVLRRDNHHCRRCEWDAQLQLDHVVPWSHLGPDRSDNLQTLCDQCNNARSNYAEAGYPQRIIGVTAVCDPCLHDHGQQTTSLHDRSGLWFECPLCRVWGEPWQGSERIPAYCGTCDWTSWVSREGRIL